MEEHDKLDYHDPEWVAEQLNIDKNAVYKYLNDGVLPGLQIGRKWLISESTLVRFLRAEERKQTEARRLSAESSTDRFEKFTEKARGALMAAQQAARSRNHNYIGQEHLLLGLVAIPDSVAAIALNNFGITTETVDSAVLHIVGAGKEPIPLGSIGLTPRAKRTLELAVEQAKSMNCSYVGTSEILVGIMAEGTGVGAGILKSKGVTLDSARGEVAKLLAGPTIAGDTEGAKGQDAPESGDSGG